MATGSLIGPATAPAIRLPPAAVRRSAQTDGMSGPSGDGGPWRGPPEVLWLERLLRGALPPPSPGRPSHRLTPHG